MGRAAMNEHPIALYLIGAAAILGAGLLTFNQEQGGGPLTLASKSPTTPLPWLKSAMVEEPQQQVVDVGLNLRANPRVIVAAPSSEPIDIKPAGRDEPVPDAVVAALGSEDRWAPAAKPIDVAAVQPTPAEPVAAGTVDGFIVIGSFTTHRSAEKHAGRFQALAPQVIAMRAGERPVRRVVVFPKPGEPLRDTLARVLAGGVTDAWTLSGSAKRRAALQAP